MENKAVVLSEIKQRIDADETLREKLLIIQSEAYQKLTAEMDKYKGSVKDIKPEAAFERGNAVGRFTLICEILNGIDMNKKPSDTSEVK